MADLRPRWVMDFETGRHRRKSQATPLAVNGLLYLPAGNGVQCLEGATGEVVWRCEFEEGFVSHRGVGYWPGDASNSARIFVVVDRELVALDASTGQLVQGFGASGKAQLSVPYQGAPTVFRNTVVVGSNVPDIALGESGNPSAYDAITGEKVWDFQTVLQGKPGTESWGEGWRGRSGTNVWAFSVTIDPLNELVYIPISAPADDFWGGDRPGHNLYSDSLVALKVRTGEYVWHFQTIHHDLWNFDLPSAPTLLNTKGPDGREVQALALAGKTGYLYILDRLTGEPIFPVEERAVATGNVPGEWYSKTQPVPVKLPPLCRTSFTRADLVTPSDTSPEHAAAAQKFWERHGGLRHDGPFTPFRVRTAEYPESTLQIPGAQGGVCWGGLALEPKSGVIYCNSKNSGQVGFMEKNSKPDDGPRYVRNSVDGGGALENTYVEFKGADGNTARLPCTKPPWANLVAVDCRKGTILWEVPLGLSESLPPSKQLTGLSLNAGPLVTAGGLVFIGATVDRRVRAFDSSTGKEVWSWQLDAPADANPMTFLGNDGQQYLGIVARDRLLVFSSQSNKH